MTNEDYHEMEPSRVEFARSCTQDPDRAPRDTDRAPRDPDRAPQDPDRAPQDTGQWLSFRVSFNIANAGGVRSAWTVTSRLIGVERMQFFEANGVQQSVNDVQRER